MQMIEALRANAQKDVPVPTSLTLCLVPLVFCDTRGHLPQNAHIGQVCFVEEEHIMYIKDRDQWTELIQIQNDK